MNASSQLGASEEKRKDAVWFCSNETGFLIPYINNMCNKSRSLNWFLWEFNSKVIWFHIFTTHFGIRKFVEWEKYDAIRIYYINMYTKHIVGCSKKVKSRHQNGKDKTLNLPHDVFCFSSQSLNNIVLGFGHFLVSPAHYLFVWVWVWHFVWFRMAFGEFNFVTFELNEKKNVCCTCTD